MAKDYSQLSKDELIELVHSLKVRKKYGLVWDDKPEDVAIQCERELPTVHAVEKYKLLMDPETPNNVLIEGDNYHALAVLAYTHNAAIDLIYIDPPYNTGAKDWKYNNKFVDANDPWRHTKWISMMSKRLLLAKRLLREDGSLICAIDDYELNTLGLLLDEIFPAHERSTIIVEHHPQGAGSITVSRTHEYAYVLTPKGIGIQGRSVKEEDDTWSLKRSGQGENNWRENRPNSFFAILVDPSSREIKGVGPALAKDEEYPTGTTKEGYLRNYPIDKEGGERVWRYNRESMIKEIKADRIAYTERGALVVKKTGSVEKPIFSVWKGARYNAGTHGSTLLTQILGKTNAFPYPKSLYTIFDMVEMIVKHKRDAVVLDFFAGSGTTAHAVQLLNAEDEGNRQWILVTNNENNICEEITYERVRRVMQGDWLGNPDAEALGGNLYYFKTGFVPRSRNRDTMKIRVTAACTDMLCLREGIFELHSGTDSYKVFKAQNRLLAVYYSMERTGLKSLKAVLEKDASGDKVLYCFTLDPLGLDPEDFAEWKDVRLEPIPQKILEVYEDIHGHHS